MHPHPVFHQVSCFMWKNVKSQKRGGHSKNSVVVCNSGQTLMIRKTIKIQKGRNIRKMKYHLQIMIVMNDMDYKEPLIIITT